MESSQLFPRVSNPPQPPMGPPILPKIAHRKTNDNPLMSRRTVQRNTESRISSRSTPIPTKAPPLLAAAVAPETFDPKDWKMCRLVTTRKSLLAGKRFHVMRLHPKQYIQVPDPTDKTGERTIAIPRKVDVTDPNEFKRPIRLHRRDPTAPLGGVMETVAAKLATREVEVDIEKQEQDALKAEKARIKAEQLSKIAPDGGAREKKRMALVKKTQQVHRVVDPGNRKIRYEEQLPWFIEDYDNTNTWQGQREHAMSNGAFMVLEYDAATSTFSMIPIEKWYKFTEIKRLNKLSEKEMLAAEKKRQAAGALPSWAKAEAKKQVFEETEELTAAEQMAYNKNIRVANTRKIVTAKGQSNKTSAGDEELDYNEERFDDDDAGAVLCFGDGDEDEEALKAVEARLKKEQLSANTFGIHTEHEYEDDIKEKQKLKDLAKQHGKKVTKALKKREGNYIYESDSDKDPYASSEESEDEDELFHKSELKKKQEAEKKKQEAEKKEAEEAAKAEAAKQQEAKKEAAKKQRAMANNARKQKKIKESSATPAVAAPPVLITHAVSKFSGKGKGNENTTLPSADTGGLSKKRARSPTPPESSNDAKRRRQNKTTGGASKAGDTLGAPGKALGNKKSLGPSRDKLEVLGGGSRNNKRKSPGSGGDNLGVPGEPKNKKKRKSSDGIEESDGVRKNKKQKHTTAPGPAVATPPLATQPTASTSTSTSTSAPEISNEEIVALLRAHPDGISIKSVANTFKGRLRPGTNDVAMLAGRLKQFGKADESKSFRLKVEFV